MSAFSTSAKVPRTTVTTSSTTTYPPLDVMKMDIAYACEQLSFLLHILMVAGFFFLLRKARSKAARSARLYGRRPREMSTRTVGLSSCVLVFGLLYTFGVFVENCLADNCSALWVNVNSLTWYVAYRASLMAVYLDRIHTVFKGSIFAYPKWYIKSLAVAIALWWMYSMVVIFWFTQTDMIKIDYNKGRNGKKMCSWKFHAPQIFYGSRLPEMLLSTVLLFSFLHKLLQLHSRVTERLSLSRKTRPKALSKIVEEEKGDDEYVPPKLKELKTMTDKRLNPFTYDSPTVDNPTFGSPTIGSHTISHLSLVVKSNDDENDSANDSDEIEDDVENTDTEASTTIFTDETPHGSKSSKGRRWTKTFVRYTRSLRNSVAITTSKRKHRKAINISGNAATRAYQTVFRRVGISALIAIVSSFLVVLGYQFYEPLAGFLALDVALNSFCVMTMFKFCHFLVKPVFGSRCQRCFCLHFAGEERGRSRGCHCHCCDSENASSSYRRFTD